MKTLSRNHHTRHRERGVTMVFVALAMVAIIAVAALSIDVITLYLAREEAQRSADAGAVAAARFLSLSGVTGDPQYSEASYWQAACTQATQVAQAVVNQNTIGRGPATTVTVTYLYNGATTDCTSGAAFAINPQVKVAVVRQGLPTFFSRIWNRSPSQVSATATAEAFNPSNSLNAAPNGLVTVNPRCVKPWIVPNHDPNNSGAPFVVLADGSIQNPGIKPASATGVIGESFALVADCRTGNPNCTHAGGIGLRDNPPGWGPSGQGAGTVDYVPALVGGNATGVPSCATGSAFQEAIAGCDQNTVYACGIVGGGAHADLTFNPGKNNGETATATECLIHEDQSSGDGQDSILTTSFPYQVQPGPNNPLLASGLTTSSVITSSNSIVSLPIYDHTPGAFTVDQPAVTIVGFLQVFIRGIDTTAGGTSGNINVTVLNVAGCSNTATASTPTVSGSSPVPVRLITPQ